jgi:hypothetical protein
VPNREDNIKQGMLNTVILPFLSDVLLGRGKPITDHIGNIRLHSIVEKYLPAYNSSRKKLEKNALASEIVERIKSMPGRFLSKDCGIWVEVDDDTARDKVMRLFRTQRQSAKHRNNQEINGNGKGGANVRVSTELQGRTGALDGQSASKRLRL